MKNEPETFKEQGELICPDEAANQKLGWEITFWQKKLNIRKDKISDSPLFSSRENSSDLTCIKCDEGKSSSFTRKNFHNFESSKKWIILGPTPQKPKSHCLQRL